MRIMGDSVLVAALLLAVCGAYAAAYGAYWRRPGWVRATRIAAGVILVLLTVANLAMLHALATHDFSISYVAQVGSRATPLFYRLLSLWGALEGSILLWAWVLAAYTALVAFRAPPDLGRMHSYALGTLLGIGAFFYLLLVGPASPFGAVWPVPLDGPGPNPLLQNHWLMAVHPPLLYLGYVGMSVPFAYAIGSLLAGRGDDRWIEVSRRWMLISWFFLCAAIVAGMWWSYEVLGWGGYWAWDPVENASFMPWLTATAYLHSSMVQERRGMLRVWNLSLVIATFLLTVLGTFLTRSGILSSVHAFANGEIGYYFLGFIALALVFSVGVLAGRSGDLRTQGRMDHVASREAVFLVNNLLLIGFTFTVLLGTLFPLLAEAARGVKVSVGSPFFNQMTIPLCIGLILLMGVGPLLPWGAPRPGLLRARLLAPLLALFAVLALCIVFRVPSIYGALAFGLAGFAAVANVQEIARPARSRVRAHGESPPLALWRTIAANQRRHGGYVAHLGVLVMAVGIAASSVYRTDHEATLRPGETLTVQGYDLRLERLWAVEEPQRFSVGADITLLRAGRLLTVLEPRLNYYPTMAEPLPTPAVRSRIEDVYVNLMAFEQDGTRATISVTVEPLVMWIWLGGGIIGLGALIAIWPRRRRPRAPRPGPGRAARPIRREPRAMAVAGGGS